MSLVSNVDNTAQKCQTVFPIYMKNTKQNSYRGSYGKSIYHNVHL